MGTNLNTSGLKVADLMVSGVVSLNPSDSIGRARELMLGHGIHGLPIVDQQGTVVGFVTSSDLVEEWPAVEPVETIMSKRVRSIEVDATVGEAAALMRAERVHHLLVNRGGRPTGIITSFDLLAALVDGQERLG